MPMTHRSSENVPRSDFRTPQACNNCRQRKIKCNGLKPSCRSCTRRKVACSWPKSLIPGNFAISATDQAFTNPSKYPPSGVLHKSCEIVALYPPDSPIPLSLAQEMFDIFFIRHHDVEFCSFMHKPSLDIAALSSRSPFLVNSIVALASIYLTDSGSSRYGFDSAKTMSEYYFREAQNFARDNFDCPTVCNIQAFLVLALYEFIVWEGLRAWSYSGIAIRMAEALRLGREDGNLQSVRQREMRRRTFWACFVVDRLISICLSRPFMIDKSSITVQLPCPEPQFAFEESYSGPTLNGILNINETQISSLNMTAIYIISVDLWGEMAKLHMQGGRRKSLHKPTDPTGSFYKVERSLEDLVEQLPANMKWSERNYLAYCSIGQAGTFVNLHVLLNHALCVMHQEYLPQLDNPITSNGSADPNFDAAGLSLDYGDPKIITRCMDSANNLTSMATMLYQGNEHSKQVLQSTFLGNALMSAAGVHLWALYTQSCRKCPRHVSRAKSELLLQIVKSLASQWRIAGAWSETLEMLFEFYSCAYGDGQSQITIWEPSEEVESLQADNDPDAENSACSHLVNENDTPNAIECCRRLADKVKGIMLLPLEPTEVKQQLVKKYMRTLYQHMWVYDALEGPGDPFGLLEGQFRESYGLFDPAF